MPNPTTLLTAEDLYKLPSDRRCELIDGILIEEPLPYFEHGSVVANVIGALASHVQAKGLGKVLTRSGFILRRDPDTVRAADIAFIRAARIPPEGLPTEYWVGAPDLAVEVIGPHDTPAEIHARVRDWVESGTSLVWIVYPESRTVNVLRSLTDRETLSEADTLDGGKVVLDFYCRVARLFE